MAEAFGYPLTVPQTVSERDLVWPGEFPDRAKEQVTFRRLDDSPHPEPAFKEAALAETLRTRQPSPAASPEQNWIWLGKFFPDQENVTAFDANEAADLKTLLETGWISAEKITMDSVPGIKALIGNDGVFTVLKILDETLKYGDSETHEKITGAKLTRIILGDRLEAGQGIDQMYRRAVRDASSWVSEEDLFNSYVAKVRNYGSRAATVLDDDTLRRASLMHGNPEMLRIAGDLKNGMSIASIAVNIWNERHNRRSAGSNDNIPFRPEGAIEMEDMKPAA